MRTSTHRLARLGLLLAWMVLVGSCEASPPNPFLPMSYQPDPRPTVWARFPDYCPAPEDLWMEAMRIEMEEEDRNSIVRRYGRPLRAGPADYEDYERRHECPVWGPLRRAWRRVF